MARAVAPDSENLVRGIAAFCATTSIVNAVRRAVWIGTIVDEAFGRSNIPEAPVAMEHGSIVSVPAPRRRNTWLAPRVTRTERDLPPGYILSA
jgi:hypothetical protein